MTQIINLHRFLKRLFLLRTELEQLLFMSICFSIMMVTARVMYTGSIHFVFLVWNLFLAIIPYAITHFLTVKPSWIESKLKFIVAFIVWILFIPNSFYILTDLYHLNDQHNVPAWFDLLLIISFAWNGLMLGIFSVRQMEKIVEAMLLYRNEILFLYPVMWLNALGVYIGRYMRFNSWDVIANPLSLTGDIIEILFHPIRYFNAWGMIMLFSVFMTIIYLTLKKISRTIW